jgi:probable addiction module antidote protein
MKTKKVYGPEGSTLNETIIKALQNDEGFREEYLKGLLTEKNIALLALSLKPVIDALGGVGKLAKETGLGRQNLYKVLSGKALPDFSTLLKIINYAGYDLSLQKIKITKSRHGKLAFSN